MASEINIPDFDFSGFYYPQILEALIQYKRRNVPELTDESRYEPFIQLLRAFALVGHLNNTLLDLVANEHTLPTAKLTETVRNMLRLINYEMRPALPSNVDVVYELSKVLLTSTQVISERAQAATQKEGNNPIIYFEALESLTIDRTDQHSYVFSKEDNNFTNYTTKANSQTTPGDDWTPWTTPSIKDSIYWGHKQVMTDTLNIFLSSSAANITGVWEFYDGEWRKIAPTSVTDLGSTLEFDLTSLLGTSNRQGTIIRIQLNQTTAYEEVESVWTGSKNIATTGLLGQTSPETDPTKYTIGSDWSILENVIDNTNDLTQNGKIEYSLPQTISKYWKKGTVNNASAYWLRYRIIDVSTPTSPIIQYTKMDDGKQYVLSSLTQGRTTTDDPLGSSTGLDNQNFETSKDYFIWGSEKVYVDNALWVRVDNFLASTAGDKHYSVVLGANDRASIIFGDGVNGRIPPLGVSNIRTIYRYNADNDGNVGANTITKDKTGLTFINKLWNPRQASGWTEAQGASEASLELAKIEGPASLRTREVALGPSDVVTLAKTFISNDGSSPFSRATAFEEGFGPKTIELVVVASGGGYASSAQLEAIEEYFNGDQYAIPPKEKHLVANQEVVAVNYSQKTINITATVYGDVEQSAIENGLTQILQPEALKEDGVTYEWEFGGEIPRSRIIHEIFQTDVDIKKVELTSPVADVQLLSRELPTIGVINITVINT